MNMRQLEVFETVMNAGSLTAAATLLGVTQPAVSQLIAQLERNCGFDLFVRSGSRMWPTREADVLHAEVKRMSIGIKHVEKVARALKNQSWGAISIGSFPVLTRRVLPDIVAKFCASRPDVRVSIESMRSRSLIDEIAARQIDLGFSVLPGDRSEVDSRYICSLRGVCIVPLHHRLAGKSRIHAKDLQGENFISLGPTDHSRFQLDKIFEESGTERRVQLEVGQSETACTLVGNGMGVSVVDPICVYNNERQNISIAAFEPEMVFDMWLITPKTARPFALIETFIDYVCAEIRTAVTDVIDRRRGSSCP